MKSRGELQLPKKTSKVNTMKPICTNIHSYSGARYTCTRYSGHSGDHWESTKEGKLLRRWNNWTAPTMNCTSTHKVNPGVFQVEPETLHCQLKAGHPGSHIKTFLTRDTVTWTDKPKELPWDQSAVDWFLKSGRGYGKVNSSYHYIVDELGIKPEPASYADDEPEETSVLLTLEDLKVLAYYLSSDDNDDDAPTRAKIDEALKGML